MQLKTNVLFSVLATIIIMSCSQVEVHKYENFITADSCQLKDGDSTFRFLSFNIPTLNFIEDEMVFTKPHAFKLPTSFETRDALESVKQLGGTVARNYTFPVKRSSDTLGIPRYITGPGQFDENSFLAMDTVLAIANEVGVRLILPFVNNWMWMGGAPQYAAFRGKTYEEFWTDSLLISDFKQTLSYILNRTNTVTGVKYKDDKAILCWETGNELMCPYSWTKEIVSYVKSIDTNHLVMDGYHAIDGVDIPIESIEDTLIDIVTTHQYKRNPTDILEDIRVQMERVNGKKVYVIGEFGFLGTEAIGRISDFIIENKNISGGLIWSLRYHREGGGFFWHSEPFGGDIYKAFHWPGFTTGIEYNEKEFMSMYRRKAYEIQGLEVPKLDVPKAPKLLPIEKVSSISWNGSAGANSYNVERSEEENGDWEVVGLNISDAVQTYTSLFNDKSVQVGHDYYYRVIARNISGYSEPSNIVGPVKAEFKTLIDDMENFTVFYHSVGKLEIVTDKDREFKEILSRIKSPEGSALIYYVPGNLRSCKIYSFSKTDSSSLKIFTSADDIAYSEVESKRESYYLGKGDYDYWIPSLYEINSFGDKNSFIKIDVRELNQIGRIEIDYIPLNN